MTEETGEGIGASMITPEDLFTPSRLCPECGAPVYQKQKGRRKKFCSETCRFAWKNKHPNPQKWKSTRTAVCPVCGQEFLASREYQEKRKYCSRACANKGRAAKGRQDE